MRRKSRIKVVMATVAVLSALALMIMRPTPAVADNARWGAGYFPNIELTTQDGNKVKFYDDLLKGKIVLIDLIYTHCVDSCPLETARLVQVQKLLGDRVGKEIFFYSITIDPKRDTPEVLKEYSEKYHVGPGWTFLTGKKEDIELISKKLGLYSDPDPNNRDGHTPSVLIGNEATGQWMRNSATDNPRFLSVLLNDWMRNWKDSGHAASVDYADAKPLTLDQGQYLFGTQCSACHTIGHGDKIGPDLLGITNVRDRTWLTRLIQSPDKMLAEGDPIVTALFQKYRQVQMPNLRLDNKDTNLIIDFLRRQTENAASDSPVTGKDSAPADAGGLHH